MRIEYLFAICMLAVIGFTLVFGWLYEKIETWYHKRYKNWNWAQHEIKPSLRDKLKNVLRKFSRKIGL